MLCACVQSRSCGTVEELGPKVLRQVGLALLRRSENQLVPLEQAAESQSSEHMREDN